jgi:enoyl-CoA hydratase/carnithine racemase
MREIVLRGRGPNTLTLDSLRRFAAELEEAGDEPVLVRGDGDAFSAGLDLDALGGDLRELLDATEEAAGALFLHPGPTVACINGHAIAGGCLLALACDHRVLKDDPSVRVGMTALALGLVYPPLVLEVLRYRLPSHALDRVLLGAERFAPNDALALGLVDELAADPLAVARERLTRLASHPRAAYAHTKRALRQHAIAVDEAERQFLLDAAAQAWDPVAARARRPR